jgi:ABC-type dipeptide/oligopeptide/nickel transport system permease subunit
MPFVTDGGGREVAMMLVAYPWVILLAACWVVGAVFVGTVGGATRGVQGFFVWTLAALMFSPLLALLGLIAVLLGDLVREIEIKAIHGPEELPLPPPRRQSGRFAHLAGEDE